MTDTELYDRVLNEFTEGFGNKYDLYLPFRQGDWTIAANNQLILGLSNKLNGIPRIERTLPVDYLHYFNTETELMGYLSVDEMNDDMKDSIFTMLQIGEFRLTQWFIDDFQKLSRLLGIDVWAVEKLDLSYIRPGLKCILFTAGEQLIKLCIIDRIPLEGAKFIKIPLIEDSCSSSLNLEIGKQFAIELNYEKVGKQISRKKLWSVTVNRVSHMAVVAENEEEARNIASQHLNDTYFDECVAKLGLELPERIDIDYCSRFNRVYSRIGVMTPEEFQNRLEQLRDFMADR